MCERGQRVSVMTRVSVHMAVQLLVLSFSSECDKFQAVTMVTSVYRITVFTAHRQR